MISQVWDFVEFVLLKRTYINIDLMFKRTLLLIQEIISGKLTKNFNTKEVYFRQAFIFM